MAWWWLAAWRHQAITWTNVDISSVMPTDIHLKVVIAPEIPQPPITKINFKITYLKFHLNLQEANELTHWDRVTHIYVSKLTIIGSDHGLSPGRRQAIIWTNAGILLNRTLRTNFSEILSEIHTFSVKMSSAKWRQFCLGPQCVTHMSSYVSIQWLHERHHCKTLTFTVP